MGYKSLLLRSLTFFHVLGTIIFHLLQEWAKSVKFKKKNSKWGLPPLPMNINRFITKYFPIETIWERTYFSIKNIGEVEYDKQNWLGHHKTQAWPKNSKWGLPPLPMNINRFITKYFPIETIRKRTYPSMKYIGEVEKEEQNWLQHYIAKLRPKGLQWIFGTFTWFTTNYQTWVNWYRSRIWHLN